MKTYDMIFTENFGKKANSVFRMYAYETVHFQHHTATYLLCAEPDSTIHIPPSKR